MLRSAFPGLFLKHDVLVPAPVPVPVPIPIPVPLPVPVPIPESCFSRRPQNLSGSKMLLVQELRCVTTAIP